MKYVIIGNSAAAVSAIEGIREHDKKGMISVISDEGYFNYSRPLISYFLAGKIGPERMSFRPKSFYDDNRVDLILGKKAERIDLKKKEVCLSGLRRLSFDKLLISTGGAPIIPEIKGMGSSGVFTFTKFEDALGIKKYAHSHRVNSAVILGGGLIGLKAAEALTALKIKVAIVELSDRLLPAAFDKKASCIIEDVLKKADCRVVVNATVEEVISKEKRVREVLLSNGERLAADLFIIGVGVRPNTELAEQAKIRINKGILVDRHMRTSAAGVYAAGDCVEAEDLLLGIKRPIAIWPSAVRTGRAAGFNMAGEPKIYQGSFAMNSVELCGIAVISAGESNAEPKEYEILEDFDQKNFTYKKLVLKGAVIKGFIFAGRIERAGIYTGLLREKVDIMPFKEHLLKDDFGLISLPKEYRKYLNVSGEPLI